MSTRLFNMFSLRSLFEELMCEFGTRISTSRHYLSQSHTQRLISIEKAACLNVVLPVDAHDRRDGYSNLFFPSPVGSFKPQGSEVLEC